MLLVPSPTRSLASYVLAALLGLALVATPGAALAAPQAQDTEQAQASAEACADTGITLVVDPAGLGGDPEVACVEGGDDAEVPAPQAFEEAGVELTPVDPFPGAVCQVDGEPADAACGAMPPADAYWGLYVAEPGGEWDFAPVGIDELQLADGGFVGFAWQSGGEPTPPAVAPQAGEAVPGGESAEGSDAAGSGEAADSAEEAPDEQGLPWWVPLLVGVVVIVLGVGIAWRRRSRT